ncbi:MAG: TolC family outer membrane protein [Pseudomonadota bacterium]
MRTMNHLIAFCSRNLFSAAGLILYFSVGAWAAEQGQDTTEAGATLEHYGALEDKPGMFPVDAIAETLRTNPEIFADKSAWLSEKHGISRAEAGYFPVVDVRVNGGFEYTRENFGRSDCRRVRGKCREDKTINTPSVNARQPLFDGFRASTDVARAQRETDQAVRKVAETQELVSFRAVNAFIDVRRFQRLLRLAIANAKAHRQILAKVNALIKGGKATIADRATVMSRLADAESAVVDIEGDLGSAVARFIDVVGQTPDRLQRSTIADGILPTTVPDALRIAEEQNRSLLLAKSTVEVAKAELDTTQVPFWPTLDVELDARRDENTEGREGHETSATALLVLRYNIFNGGADLARRKEIAERVAENRHREASALRTSGREVRVSWAEMKSAMRQSEALRASVEQKEKVIRAYEKQFDLGTRSLLDLLDAWNEFFLAKGSLITVDATTDLTGYRLLAAMGTLLSAHNLAVPIEAAAPSMDVEEGRVEMAPISDTQEMVTQSRPDPIEVQPEVKLDSAPKVGAGTARSGTKSRPVAQRTVSSKQSAAKGYTYDDSAVGHGIRLEGALISGESVTYDN